MSENSFNSEGIHTVNNTNDLLVNYADMTFVSSFSSRGNSDERENIIKSALDTLSTIGTQNTEANFSSGELQNDMDAMENSKHETKIRTFENLARTNSKADALSPVTRNLREIDIHSVKSLEDEIIGVQNLKHNGGIEKGSAKSSLQTKPKEIMKRERLKSPLKNSFEAIINTNNNTSRENSDASVRQNIPQKNSNKLKSLKKAWPKASDQFSTNKIHNTSHSRRSTPKTISRIHTPRNESSIGNVETSYDQQNALHGNEIATLPRENNFPKTLKTEHLHFDSRNANNKNMNINNTPGPSGVVQLTFEGSYSCRVLRKEKNVGVKVHKELKKREKEVGAPKVITLVSGRGISRESTAGKLTAKMRSRKNSIVDFFHRRINVDKQGQKQSKLTEPTTKVFDTGDSASPTRKVELYLPVFDEAFDNEDTEIALHDFGSDSEEDESPKFINTFQNTQSQTSDSQTNKISIENECCDEESVATDNTYNMLQHSNIKKRIEELERLKRNKRKKSRVLDTVTTNVKGDSSDDVDIAAEKTYKKMVPRVKRLSKKVLPIVSSKQSTTDLKKMPILDKIKRYSSSGCEFVTADTHSSRVQSRGLQVSGNIASRHQRYDVSEDSMLEKEDNDNIVAWTDEHGNACEVEKANGKYGTIKCKNKISTTIGNSSSSRQIDTTIQKDPLSPKSVRKKQDASAQVWAPLVTSAMTHERASNSDKCGYEQQSKGVILYTDGLGKVMRFPLKV